MTNDEIQKTMEFILTHQAQASAKIDGILESQKQAQRDWEQRWARTEEKWARTEEKWARTEEGIRALLQIAEIHEREISTLGDQIREVSENGRATDERLNALVNTVERMISEGRNGKP